MLSRFTVPQNFDVNQQDFIYETFFDLPPRREDQGFLKKIGQYLSRCWVQLTGNLSHKAFGNIGALTDEQQKLVRSVLEANPNWTLRYKTEISKLNLVDESIQTSPIAKVADILNIGIKDNKTGELIDYICESETVEIDKIESFIAEGAQPNFYKPGNEYEERKRCALEFVVQRKNADELVEFFLDLKSYPFSEEAMIDAIWLGFENLSEGTIEKMLDKVQIKEEHIIELLWRANRKGYFDKLQFFLKKWENLSFFNQAIEKVAQKIPQVYKPWLESLKIQAQFSSPYEAPLLKGKIQEVRFTIQKEYLFFQIYASKNEEEKRESISSLFNQVVLNTRDLELLKKMLDLKLFSLDFNRENLIQFFEKERNSNQATDYNTFCNRAIDLLLKA